MSSGIYKLTFFTCLFFVGVASSAQDLTGIWRGYFITETGDNYRLEFQIGVNPAKFTKGVSYSYLDKRFYGKATMSGHYNEGIKVLQIQELKTVEVRNLGGGGTCIMNYKLTYSRSGREEFLEGTYLGKSENMDDPEKNGKWGDCGYGKVFLRRVVSSDFYIEPFLKNKPKNDQPVVKADPKKTTAPVKKQTDIKTKENPVVISKPKRDSIVKSDVVTDPSKKIVPKTQPLPRQTRARENDLVKTVVVSNAEITVKLYDNGEIDDDTVTVYMDDKAVLSKKRLSASPLTIQLKMDEENPEHVLIMVAENLGRIPPNTSLMIVNDGDKRHEVRITSTEQKNAMVRFRYEKN